MNGFVCRRWRRRRRRRFAIFLPPFARLYDPRQAHLLQALCNAGGAAVVAVAVGVAIPAAIRAGFIAVHRAGVGRLLCGVSHVRRRLLIWLGGWELVVVVRCVIIRNAAGGTHRIVMILMLLLMLMLMMLMILVMFGVDVGGIAGTGAAAAAVRRDFVPMPSGENQRGAVRMGGQP